MSKKLKYDPGNLTIAQIKKIVAHSAQLDNEFIASLAADPRVGVRNIYRLVQQKAIEHDRKLACLKKLFIHENDLYDQGFSIIAGVDEAGRGPLAGPVVAAAVVLPGFVELPGLRDSKKLSPEARRKMAVMIKEVSMDWSISLSTVSEILCYNIYWASLLAMRRAIQGLRYKPEYLLVDGFPIKDLDIHQKALVGGDDISASIAAASVLAKVTRDELMRVLHIMHPQYGFKKHKGYGTKEHLQALQAYGPCAAHRTDFAPVKRLLCCNDSREG